jgi:hypothetical protein
MHNSICNYHNGFLGLICAILLHSCNTNSDINDKGNGESEGRTYLHLRYDSVKFNLLLPIGYFKMWRSELNEHGTKTQKVWIKEDSCQITYSIYSVNSQIDSSNVYEMKKWVGNKLDISLFMRDNDLGSGCVTEWAIDSTWVSTRCQDEYNDYRHFLIIIDGWYLECTIVRRPYHINSGYWNEMFTEQPIIVEQEFH